VGKVTFEQRIAQIANDVARRLGVPARYFDIQVQLKRDYVGGGYGVVGDLEREAILLMARMEGILLDPVYTGRAMGGLLDMIRNREFGQKENVLFWHTGGIPALFPYARELTQAI
jgi:D-cysteine desulfhydrase